MVDPENRIPLTTDIPPQQTHWAREAIHNALVKDRHRLKVSLPKEVVDMVVDRVDNVMTLVEAKAHREQLMDERTEFARVVIKQHFCTEFLVDLRMIELSYALRCKNSWWTKITDPNIRSKWAEEASEQTIRGAKLNEDEIEWVLDELEDYATMRDEATGIQPSCHVRVWESDALISQELRSELISEAAVLENVPEDEKDWHPRSDNLVLDLVHPSLFCAVYERTQSWNTVDDKKILAPLRSTQSGLPDWAYSKRFSWIPTDFQVGHDGTPARALGYINNVHPQTHKDLVPVIEALVGRFSLLWDRVLTDIHPDNYRDLPGRKKTDGLYGWVASEEHPKPSWSDCGSMSEEEFDKLDQAYEENRTISLPWVDEKGYHESGQDVTERNATYSIQGKTVQVIVKLANIHLSPDKPEYQGGSWHVEGMANERIVASGIYYYDCSNITDSHIAFRVAVHFGSHSYEQSDGEGIELTWGLEYGQESNQVVGAVKTSVNRCIAFPNIYQHQVSSFKLVDPTKPGYRKILALFLVDPETRVPSTTDIPPQQSHWSRQALYESFVKGDHGVKVPLPQELVDMVVDNVDGVMTLVEAKACREQLMDERTALVGEVNKQHFCTEFNFCEH
ncbi:hypothetical protein FRC04_004800 [Tulasnella sp. 424]|nr:hypothetical protein FRC04_004800 [Tulasnella sp. 424]